MSSVSRKTNSPSQPVTFDPQPSTLDPRPAILINRSPHGSGLEALRRARAALGIHVSVDRYAVALAALSLLALGPMLQPGYFWSAHDARHSVYFLFEFDRVFRSGVWYPRWFPDMTYGYGYPLFNIYGPLAFYVGEVFHLLGADFVTAVKIVFALAWALSGWAMYGFVRRIFDHRPAALIAGLAYVFMPYHIVDVYVRAALAESVALVFLPLTLWAFYETAQTRTIRSLLFAAFAYAGMVFAHNGIALLFSPVLGAWIVWNVRTLERENVISPSRLVHRAVLFVRAALPTLAGLALGLGLTGIFLLPLIFEYRYINVEQWTANYYHYQEHFVEFYQLFSPTWGFGISQSGPEDGLSFQLGVVPVILAFFSLFVIARNPRPVRAIILFFLGLTLLVVLLMFSFSLPAWQIFGLASVAQFPWRLLTLTMVSLAVLCGAVLLWNDDQPITNTQPLTTNSTFSTLPLLAISALLLLGSYPYLTAPIMLQPKEGPVGLAGLMRFQRSANEMTGTTVYAQEQPRWSDMADLMLAGKTIRSKIDYSHHPDWLFIRVTRNGLTPTGERVDYHAPNGAATIIFNVQMYPGWRVYLTKSRSTEILRELPIEIEPPYGRIKVTVPQGEYGLWLRFEDTLPRTFGTILSAASLCIALGLFIWTRKMNRPTTNHTFSSDR